jgi:hypothetical protein
MALVHAGNSDGGHAGDGACYDSMAQIVRALQGDYAGAAAAIKTSTNCTTRPPCRAWKATLA